MFFLILLGNPIGHRKHFAVAGVSERKADGGRSPLLAGATPGDAFPCEVGRLEFLLLLGGFVDLNPLVLSEPVDILVDERILPLGRGHLKEDGSDLVGRLAGDALVGLLRFPRVGDVHRNRWLVLGDVHRARRGKAGEQEKQRKGSDGSGDLLHCVHGIHSISQLNSVHCKVFGEVLVTNPRAVAARLVAGPVRLLEGRDGSHRNTLGRFGSVQGLTRGSTGQGTSVTSSDSFACAHLRATLPCGRTLKTRGSQSRTGYARGRN